MTPNELAATLPGVGKENAEKVGKAFVRPYLRRHFARPAEAKGSSWTLDAEQVKAVRDAWKARTQPEPKA
jgi:hypothetical protein